MPEPKILFMKKYQFYLFLFAFTAGFVSCSSDDSNPKAEMSQVEVRLTDAPGDYSAVYVEVEDVMINTSAEGSEEESWESLGEVNHGPHDLLQLTGGITEILVDTEIPSGYLNQIRLVLGDNNYVVVEDGEGGFDEMVLKTPSGQESGLKLQVNQELLPNAAYTFILDFDVDQSIVDTSEGNFNLKPVIRVSVEESSGTIMGSVHPTKEQVVVIAENGSVKASAYTNENGEFAIHGLPAGTYKITATPEDGVGLDVSVVNNISVSQGASVTVDTLFLDSEEPETTEEE